MTNNAGDIFSTWGELFLSVAIMLIITSIIYLWVNRKKKRWSNEI